MGGNYEELRKRKAGRIQQPHATNVDTATEKARGGSARESEDWEEDRAQVGTRGSIVSGDL